MEHFQSLTPPVFAPSDPALLSHLHTHGYAAVAALTPTEADAAHTAFWNWLEGLGTGVLRSDPSTHMHPDKWPAGIHGIIKGCGVGQAPFMWHLRTHPAVRQAFATVWGTNALICSFDGAGMYPKVLPQLPKTYWPHRDQAPTADGLLCVQGVLSLTSNEEDTAGGLVVWPGSHLRCWANTYAEARAHPPTAHWYRVPEGDPVCTPHAGWVLRAPAGTLFLWDSRTVHMNRPPCAPARTPRAVAYICMAPKALASASTLKKRLLYFETNRTTSHWPHHVHVNPEGKPYRSAFTLDSKTVLARLPPPDSSDPDVRALVGY